MSLSEKFFHELQLEDYELKMLYEQNKLREESFDDVKQPLCNAIDKFREDFEGESLMLFELFLLQEIARRWMDSAPHQAYIRGAGYYK